MAVRSQQAVVCSRRGYNSSRETGKGHHLRDIGGTGVLSIMVMEYSPVKREPLVERNSGGESGGAAKSSISASIDSGYVVHTCFSSTLKVCY